MKVVKRVNSDRSDEVAVDSSGKYVYSIEIDNYRVQKFNPDGKYMGKWGYEKTGGHGAYAILIK